MPLGLYRVVVRVPARGQLAVIRLPRRARALAAARGYLAPGALLIKPVAAGPGDVVCRYRATITINGRPAARARRADAAGRLLPRWSGCITLAADHVFVLATTPDSFDGRYFGPLDRTRVLGTAHPVWVSPLTDTPRSYPVSGSSTTSAVAIAA